MNTPLRLAVVLLVVVGKLGAQETETKTVELRHLKPREAVNLLSPYVKAKDGGVFSVAENIAVVTLRDFPANITHMQDVLAKYDHTPATIRLVFQLIEADTGSRAQSANDQVSPDLDATLRSVL